MSFDSWVNHGAPLSEKSFRGVNNNDVVTAVPPEFSDYQHVGTKVYINSRWVGVEASVRDRFERGTATDRLALVRPSLPTRLCHRRRVVACVTKGYLERLKRQCHEGCGCGRRA